VFGSMPAGPTVADEQRPGRRGLEGGEHQQQ
jgi:hypothetical protein